ncbi:lytic transglycosylase domain-containing protein [Flavobacterium pedocola]
MKVIRKTLVIASVVVVSGLFIYATSSLRTVHSYVHTTLPADMNFCGEKVPMQLADVSERLDRELTVNINLHATTELVIKRANRAFPVIEPILKKYGVPDDFKYLAVIESGLINATSPSGAKGVWQFMPATAKEIGMEVSETVDERYDLEKSTEFACKYLLKAKEKSGSWTLAAASYNGGLNGILRMMEEQKVNDYYDMLLTDETYRYVFRILALKEIMQNQEKYGYQMPPTVLYPLLPTKKVEVNANIDNLAQFAIDQGVNYKILKIHNPWLRDKKLVVLPNKVYTIQIPLEGYVK